jgi:nitrile hydratase alpha subunit
VEALDRGADVVITGRVTDAAVVMGPPAHAFRWQRQDWDRLAGACVAGHVIECGCQATGGNYSFFTEIPGMDYLGFPIAEIFPDGSSVITKHAGTGGAVTIGTVTSQLLYEIGSERYLNPDVVCRFDTIRLEEVATDRVRISATKGEPAPATLKVSMNYQGGFRNGFTFCLTGLDIDAKADLLQRQIWSAFPGGKDHFEQARVQLMRTDKTDPESNEAATALLKFTVKDRDERKVGRDFANQAVEIGLATIPGFYGLGWSPGPGTPYGVYWPSLVPSELVPQEVVILGDGATAVDNTPGNLNGATVVPPTVDAPEVPLSISIPSGTVRAPLGAAFGSRSGDKGGNANLGVFARSAPGYAWLASFLTVERLKQLLPDLAELPVHRYELPNIWSLNFVVVGLLEEGVAASSRQDGQAKSLGEYLRAKVVDLPEVAVNDHDHNHDDHDHDHDHDDHSDIPPDVALRARALQSLLVEKGLIKQEDIDRIIESLEHRVGPHLGARLVARAWVDPAFKDRLLADGIAAAAELGIGGFSHGARLVVVENTDQVHNVVVCTLCSCYPIPVLGLPPVWYKSAPYRSRVVMDPRGVLAEFGTEVDPHVGVQVWDSNSEVRYLVLPQRPAGTDEFSEEQLAALVGRNAMIGVEPAHRPDTVGAA